MPPKKTKVKLKPWYQPFLNVWAILARLDKNIYQFFKEGKHKIWAEKLKGNFRAKYVLFLELISALKRIALKVKLLIQRREFKIMARWMGVKWLKWILETLVEFLLAVLVFKWIINLFAPTELELNYFRAMIIVAVIVVAHRSMAIGTKLSSGIVGLFINPDNHRPPIKKPPSRTQNSDKEAWKREFFSIVMFRMEVVTGPSSCGVKYRIRNTSPKAVDVLIPVTLENQRKDVLAVFRNVASTIFKKHGIILRVGEVVFNSEQQQQEFVKNCETI